MFGFSKTITFATLLVSTFVSAAPSHNDDSIIDWGRLSSILDTIDTGVLHSVLHNLAPKFQDGVFSRDRAAIEHVHSQNPILATKLVYLAKRQNNGTTTGGAGVAASTTRAASTTSVPPVESSVSQAVSSQIYNTATTIPAPTTISVAPSTPAGATAVSTIPGAVVFSTSGGGVVTLTSSAVGVRFTKSTSTHLYYTTLPNGQVQTSTSLVIVNAPITDTSIPTGAAGAATTTGAPGLQNGGVRAGVVGLGGFFAGAIGLLAYI